MPKDNFEPDAWLELAENKNLGGMSPCENWDVSQLRLYSLLSFRLPKGRGPAEKAGKEIDKAFKEAGKAVKKTAESVKEATKKESK